MEKIIICLRCGSGAASVLGNRQCWSLAWLPSTVLNGKGARLLYRTLSNGHTTLVSKATEKTVSRHHNHQTFPQRRYQHRGQSPVATTVPLHHSPSLSTIIAKISCSRCFISSRLSPSFLISNNAHVASRTQVYRQKLHQENEIKSSTLIYCPSNKGTSVGHRCIKASRTRCKSPLSVHESFPGHVGINQLLNWPPKSRQLNFALQQALGIGNRRYFSCFRAGQLQYHKNHQFLTNLAAQSIFSRQASSLSMAELSSQQPQSERDGVLKNGNSNNIVQLSQIDYKTAIQLLNQLQTNAENIAQAIEKEKSSNAVKSLEKTRYFLSLIDIEPKTLNRLQVIHVAGTKGKGSTCAFVESILRHKGYKTGFYSSPHLVMARERIRLNGEPISEDLFTANFASVYGAIKERKSIDSPMPAYFNFMTLMALKIFLEEGVDVAILEVGIGGEYDCTNVVPKPVVTGVTSLDLDHTKLLGDTIEAIAWQKAGIFKEGVPAFTVPGQAEGALDVLKKRAEERRCQLYLAPSWDNYPPPPEDSLHLGINGEVQKINASLAVQLTNCWLQRSGTSKLRQKLEKVGPSLAAIEDCRSALASTKWFGRCEVIETGGPVTYFLDAAHTPHSMQNCRDWFELESRRHFLKNDQNTEEPHRILIFNCTGDRNPRPLLSKLNELSFSRALFTTNSIYGDKTASSDVANFTVTTERERQIADENFRTMGVLNGSLWSSRVDCISEAIANVEKEAMEVQTKFKGRPVHVLITGSVHLVGGFIGLLHPHYRSDDHQHRATKL